MSEIDFETAGRAGVITLNRPKALNALTKAMIEAMGEALDEWARDDRVERVAVKAEGKAFCAGGDIRAVYQRRSGAVDFFAAEYRNNARVHAFPKPYVALLDGVVMGGGVGISVHGSHRLGGENMVFAMPEVGIGLFPDVGASHVLSRLPQRRGLHLALTGHRLGRDEAAALGLVTHPVESARLSDALDRITHARSLDAALDELRVATEPDDTELPALIEDWFAPKTLAQTVERLETAAAEHEAADRAVKAMRRASPTSLHVTHRRMQEAADASFEEVMRTDFRIVSQILEGHDFYEGIRAVVIDKDNAPKWSPGAIDAVDPEAVEAHFREPSHGDLDLAVRAAA